jgi:translation initiation factor 3 subunit A
MIFPPNRKQSKLELLLPCLLEVVAKDHKMMLARKSIIEKRKEEQEQQRLEMV